MGQNGNMGQGEITINNRFKGAPVSPVTGALLSEEAFRSVLWRESKRSERSQKHLMLMLIDHGVPCEKPSACRALIQAARVLDSAIRETDIAGWFDTNCVLGVIFTEFGDSDVASAMPAIKAKVTASLRRAFTAQQLNKFHFSFYAFPDQWLEDERATARERHQVAEPKVSEEKSPVETHVFLRWPLRVAELCSPSQRLRLD